ncbi:Peptidoglycan/LPS O-acetylase OafA/YrhL, contains acyltransferase and SGNH-hydrolase domains [Xaviernesmea oryzae]|nr:Peptidoglycan/LPS O-acetylase OafA/YrhL, contains acyltransferase and SGNH-hydrolase domains [Xaviernesmea oryzae]
MITKIIYSEINSGIFDIWNFYERRARRILPAILAVYLAVMIGSFLILMPSETAQQARNAISSMAFVSNIYFYEKFDYFDASSEFNALLHTWSLSVEEQFYLFFPPLLFVTHKFFPKAVKPAIVLVAILTLVQSQMQIGSDPSAVFYLVHYRAWELMIGSILAIGLIPVTASPVISNLVSAVGLLSIVGSALLLDRTSQFPGLAAAPACLGAAAIIWAGTKYEPAVAKLLALSPAQFFGRISYSLYLWHWPIWVLGSQLFEPKNTVHRLIYISIAILCATISYYVVEQPFRRRTPSVSAKRVVFSSSVSLAIMTVAALALPSLSQAFWRVSARVEEVASFINYRADQNFRVGKCFLTSRFNKLSDFHFDDCLAMASDKPNYLLLGDSHAAHFYPGLASRSEFNLLQATASGCRPIDTSFGEKRCVSLFSYITDEFLPTHKVDTVIISARWQEGDMTGLAREIAKIEKFVPNVIVFGPIAEYDKALPRVLAQSLYLNDPELPAHHLIAVRKAVDADLAKGVPGTGAQYVSVYDTLCPAGSCEHWTADGNPIQSDYGHLTTAGSMEIVRRMQPVLLAGFAP